MLHIRRHLTTQTSMNMVPMIDVVLQLILYFMVSTTLILTPGIKLVLPSSSTSQLEFMDKLLVTVISRDEIYMNDERVTLEALDEKLSRFTPQQREELKGVVLEGDQAISYSLVIEVLDTLRRNGFKGVNMRTRESS